MDIPYLSQAIVIDFAIKVGSSVVLLLSYLESRNKIFIWWSAGWFFFAIHAFLEHVILYYNFPILWFFRHFVFALGGIMFFYGVCSTNNKVSCVFSTDDNCWLCLVIFSIIAFFSAYIGIYVYDSWFLSALPSSFLAGFLLLVSGYYYNKIAIDRKAFYNKLIMAGFILNGLHKMDYPFLRKYDDIAVAGFTLCALFTLVFAVGMILKSKNETTRQRRVNLERIREVATLYSVTSAISRGKELDQILYTVLDDVLRALKMDAGVIFIINEDTGDLILKAKRGLSDEHAKDLAKVEFSKKSVTEQAIKKNEIIIASDISRMEIDEDLKRGLIEDKIDNFVAVPLRSGSKILGVLDVGVRRPHRYSSEDIRLLESIGNELGIAVDNKQLLRNLDRSYLSTVLTLTDIVEAKDHYTRSHSDNVTRYAVAIAKEMNLPNEKIEKIRLAAELHDLGKVAISDEILHKKGKLTKKEWDQVKQHPEKAVEILKPLAFLREQGDILDYIRSHHERYNGKGYPNGFKEHQIKLGARILAAADSYDAMISQRPYRKKPLSKKEAIEELKENSGTQFDPEVVEAFLKVLEREGQKKEKY